MNDIKQADYSKIEERIMAQQSHENQLETHEQYAKRKYGITELSLEQRQLIKQERLVEMYGRGPQTAHRLARIDQIVRELETMKYPHPIPNIPAMRTTPKDRVTGESKRQRRKRIKAQRRNEKL